MIKNLRPLTVNLIDTMEVLPRAPPKMLKGQERVNTPWDFLNSVFAKYKPDIDLTILISKEPYLSQLCVTQFYSNSDR